MSDISYSIVPQGTQYLTASGLAAVAHYESGGNPTAKNASSSASGLYGIINSTWNFYAGSAIASQYPTAGSAPPEIQTQVAAQIPVSNWTCRGCDPAFTAALANNPNWVSNSPNLTGQNLSSDTGAILAGTIASQAAATNGSGSTNSTAGNVAGTTASGGILTGTTPSSFWEDVFIFILAIAFILIAVWPQSVTKLVSTAKRGFV